MTTILVTSANLISDTSLRKRLQKTQTLSEEVSIILQDALAHPPVKSDSGVTVTLCGPPNGDADVHTDEDDDLQLSAKLFLRSFSVDSLTESIGRLQERAGLDTIHNLILAVPVEGVKYIGLGRTGEVEQMQLNNAMTGLCNVWRAMERLVETKVVSRLGVCDIDEDTLKNLYQQVDIKPKTIQINLQSCCAVPSGLQAFAQDNGITLLTHRDPPDMLTDSMLDVMEVGPEYGGGAGGGTSDAATDAAHTPPCGAGGNHLRLDWMIRYQTHQSKRGVLFDKRYLVALTERRN